MFRIETYLTLLMFLSATNCLSPPSPDPLSALTCSPTPDGYLVADPRQCDRYAECTPEGRKVISLCPDGLVVSLSAAACDLPAKVDCSTRPKRQPAAKSGLCPRANGVFPLDLSCNRYLDCREGQLFIQSCGAGAVFDPNLGCVHPDETTRPGCTAEEQYNFHCPNPKELVSRNLKFGDHLRLPHPTDCRLFYACLVNGQPRLLSCEKPKVFNPESELCENQDFVRGCEDTYLPEEIINGQEIERLERLEKELLLLRKSGLLGS